MATKSSSLERLHAEDVSTVIAAAEELSCARTSVPPEALFNVARRLQAERDSRRRLVLGRAYLRLLGGENGAEVAETWLDEEDANLREAAFQALADFGPEALPVLSRLARHPARDVRWFAVEALRHLRAPAAASALVTAMTDDDFSVRWVAARGLIELGPPALLPLVEGLVRLSPSITFHGAARTVLPRISTAEHSAEIAGLLDSLAHETTVYETPPRAAELLLKLRRRSQS